MSIGPGNGPPINTPPRVIVMPTSSATDNSIVPAFLTIEETALLLRTTRKAVYALVERRQIPGVTRIGRRVLVRSDELLDWLRQKSESHR